MVYSGKEVGSNPSRFISQNRERKFCGIIGLYYRACLRGSSVDSVRSVRILSAGVPRQGRPGSVLLRKEQGRAGPVAFGDQPKFLAHSSVIAAQNAKTVYHAVLVLFPVEFAQLAPVAADMAA